MGSRNGPEAATRPHEEAAPVHSRVRAALPLLLGALVFALAHTQAPLYYSNQNQYFLHGLARAGVGLLNEDWLANTADPTPVFSALVAVTARHLPGWMFYAYYLLILGLYFICLVGLYDFLTGLSGKGLPRLVFITLLVTVHAGGLRLASVLLLGKDYPWYFQAGVANQYVLGPGLQPSVFGVFLLASLLAFLHNRLALAVVCSSLAAIFHATYLLPAAILTAAYLVRLLLDGRGRQAALYAVAALALVLPTLVWNLLAFAPSTATLFHQAQDLLVHTRLPHHTIVERWLDLIAVLQIAWIGLGIFLVRGTRLFVILLLTFVLSVALTLVQVATGSNVLALLFPWRVSAVLVPVATAIVLTRLVQAVTPWLARQSWRQALRISVSCCVVLGLLVASGLTIQMEGLAYRTNPDEEPLLAWVQAQRAPGQVFLLPVELPTLGAGPRGAASLSFTPPPRPGERHLIAVDFLRFRLATGTPIFVDFKSIPYRDRDVLAWYQRMQFCQRFYQRQDWPAGAIKADLTGNHITHVVTTADKPMASEALEKVYEDPSYCVYRVR